MDKELFSFTKILHLVYAVSVCYDSGLTRRSLLASALFAGCARKLAPRYVGWLFVASAAERGIAVADLSTFQRITTVPLAEVPEQLMMSGGRVFVSCPDARSISSIDPERLRVDGRISVPGRIAAMAIVPGSSGIAVITTEPDLFLLIDSAAGKITKRLALPVRPLGLDVNRGLAAIGGRGSILRVALPALTLKGTTPIDGNCGAIRIRANGETVLAGIPERKEIVTIDSDTGTLLAHLPLAFQPSRFCFNSDGGQMFVTGTEGDAIAIIDPYQNQVEQTIVGGSTPFGVAVGVAGSQSLLLVTNPGSGDLTIFDIETRGLAASVHIGGNPGDVLLTPGGEYALVIGRDSGDVAVVRITSVLDTSVLNKHTKLKPLFTVFPSGGSPRSALIVPRTA